MIMFARTSLVLMAAALMASTAADSVTAQPRPRPNNPQYRAGYDEGYRDAYRQAYRQGYRDARDNRRFVDTDYAYGYGYDNNNDYNGPGNNDPRYQRWRTRYAQTYTYQDDSFYRECRTSVDPGGVIDGALIGGLLGNAIG